MKILYLSLKTNAVAFGYTFIPAKKRTPMIPKHFITTTGFELTDTLEYAEPTSYFTESMEGSLDNLLKLYAKYSDEETLVYILHNYFDFQSFIANGPSSFKIGYNDFTLSKEEVDKLRSTPYKEVLVKDLPINHVGRWYLSILDRHIVCKVFDSKDEIKTYWRKISITPTLAYGRFLLINPSVYPDEVYTTKAKIEMEIGRPLPMVTESIIQNGMIPDLLDRAIRNAIDSEYTDESLLSIDLGNLSTLLSMKALKDYPELVTTVKDRLTVKTLLPNGEKLISNIQPPGLSNKIMDNIHTLLDSSYEVKDITGEFYLDGKIRKEVLNSKHIMKIDIGVASCIVMLSVDSLPRNHFKQLEKYDPRVYLEYKVEEKKVKYRTRIETTVGRVIVHSPYNSQTVLYK